ncbi:MAG: NRDE family protein [Lewinellaceae bacterium]|nr:NRDE family protein [Lewinellaceae bacterium]
MCTVTFIPQENGGFLLTSNRDEAPSRSSMELVREDFPDYSLVFPRDLGAGGTWVAAASDDRVVCLLNGAFHQHKRIPPYRLSRGIMVLHFFTFSNAQAFAQTYDFHEIEPFTLVIYDRGSLWELRWDGHQSHFQALDVQAEHLWSSATLYDGEAQALRRAWFTTWQNKRKSCSREDVLGFHTQTGADDPWNGVVMNRFNVVRTVSITTLDRTEAGIDLFFRDLLQEEEKKLTLPLQASIRRAIL